MAAGVRSMLAVAAQGPEGAPTDHASSPHEVKSGAPGARRAALSMGCGFQDDAMAAGVRSMPAMVAHGTAGAPEGSRPIRCTSCTICHLNPRVCQLSSEWLFQGTAGALEGISLVRNTFGTRWDI